jgi:hypothetical protein
LSDDRLDELVENLFTQYYGVGKTSSFQKDKIEMADR